MLRLARLTSRLPPVPIGRRNFVSSALLTRAWQNDTIADLRSEAKLRGLSAKGSKSALASRIEDYEKNLALQSSTSGSRYASSIQSSSHTETEVPGNPELPPVSAADIFDVKIPDLSQPIPETPIQIPFLPDYWNSSVYAPHRNPTQEESLPKLLVVAGAETHPGGGPSHNLLDLDHVGIPQKAADTPTRSSDSKETETIFDDIAEDLGLPRVKDIKTSLWKLL